jgi:hypothetical protein
MARPEVTGKKITATETVIAKKKMTPPTGPPDDAFDIEELFRQIEEFYKQHSNLDAFDVEEFCRRHSISVPFYYKLRSQGLGPREMLKGTRVLITREAAADWRREGEAATAMKRRERELAAAESE